MVFIADRHRISKEVITGTCFARLVLCAIVLVIELGVLGCATPKRHLLILYEEPQGKRLQASEVAQILMGGLAGMEKILWVVVDSAWETPLRDTLEVLPGNHSIQLWNLANRNSRYEPVPSYPPPGSGCLQFEFKAEAAHRYGFVLTEYSWSDWRVDLVDQDNSSRVVHGSHCPRPKRYWPRP